MHVAMWSGCGRARAAPSTKIQRDCSQGERQRRCYHAITRRSTSRDGEMGVEGPTIKRNKSAINRNLCVSVCFPLSEVHVVMDRALALHKQRRITHAFEQSGTPIAGKRLTAVATSLFSGSLVCVLLYKKRMHVVVDRPVALANGDEQCKSVNRVAVIVARQSLDEKQGLTIRTSVENPFVISFNRSFLRQKQAQRGGWGGRW